MDVMNQPAQNSTGRLRWHSRRALLELDLLLERFWQRQGEQALDPADASLLAEVLLLEDHDLWDMLCGRKEVPDARWQALLDRLNQTTVST